MNIYNIGDYQQLKIADTVAQDLMALSDLSNVVFTQSGERDFMTLNTPQRDMLRPLALQLRFNAAAFLAWLDGVNYDGD